jgi:hypothetical protein
LCPTILPQKGGEKLGVKNCAQLPINKKWTHGQMQSAQFIKPIQPSAVLKTGLKHSFYRSSVFNNFFSKHVKTYKFKIEVC